MSCLPAIVAQTDVDGLRRTGGADECRRRVLVRTAASAASCAGPVITCGRALCDQRLGGQAGCLGGAPGVTAEILGPRMLASAAGLDAQGGLRGPAVGDELVGVAFGLINGNGEAQPDRPGRSTRDVPAERRDGRIDPDQLAVHIDQRPARAPGIERGVGLNGLEHWVLVGSSPAVGTVRFNALIMSAVTVPCRPSGAARPSEAPKQGAKVLHEVSLRRITVMLRALVRPRRST